MFKKWRHVFKLDPDKYLSDEALEQLCHSGTDAILIGGSSGMTFENTYDLFSRVSSYGLPIVSEVTSPDAIVPGPDAYFIPFVMNTTDLKWFIGKQHEAVRKYGEIINWSQLFPEGYVILNGQCTAAKKASAQTNLSPEDVLAYARMADKIYHFPIFYMEYSGQFGDMMLLQEIQDVLEESQLFYGGGIDCVEKASIASRYAQTIVVGNVIYENLPEALQTVKAIQSFRN